MNNYFFYNESISKNYTISKKKQWIIPNNEWAINTEHRTINVFQ